MLAVIVCDGFCESAEELLQVQSIPFGCVRTPEPCGQRGEPEPLMTLQLKSDKAAAMMAE